MPISRVDLVLDDTLGIAIWAREETGSGRSRPVPDLAVLVPASPAPLATVLDTLTGPLRHRATLPRQRVPARHLEPAELAALLAALRECIGARARQLDTDPVALLARLGEDGSALRLSDDLVAMPGLLAAVRADDAARTLVEARHLRPVLVEHPDGVRARWRALDARGEPLEDPLLDALVDHRARGALAELIERLPAPGATTPDPAQVDPSQTPLPHGAIGSGSAPVTEPAEVPPRSTDADRGIPGVPPAVRGAAVLAALQDPARTIRADLPAVRRIGTALDAFLTSARARVRVGEGDLELVVRLHEPPLGSAWPLQTCLRESDGTVHPVAELRAVGDVTAAGAAEAAGTILRHAPTLRTAQVDATGTDWLLTTSEASAFLTLDAPLLDAAGVTAMLPRGWTAQRTSVRPDVEDAPAERTGPAVGLQAMMSFRWKVAVGDIELTEEEIAEIREAQSELVHLRGAWVRLDPATLRAAERFLDAFRRTSGDESPDRMARVRAIASRPGVAQRTEPRGTGLLPLDPADGAVGGAVSAPPDGSPGAPGTAARGDLSLRDWLALLASAEADGVEIGGAGVDGEIARLVEAHAQAPDVPPPATLDASLRPYQQRGLDWMWFLDVHGLGGILADDMGLGKTMQVLALLCREREVGRVVEVPAAGSGGVSCGPDHAGASPVGPTLLVCPMSVVGSWQREAERFAPHLRVHVHHGQDRVRDVSFLDGVGDVDLVLTTYALLARDLPLLQRAAWHRIVFDEAQHVKNPATAVSRAARAIPAPHRLALTGTPVENRLHDLHALMEVVNPGLLGSAASFQERIARPIEAEADPSAVSRLRRLTAPFVLRRVKTDRTIIADLPAKNEFVQRVNLTPEQAGLYEALVHEMLTQLDGADEKQRRSLVVSTITRLKQVCNHPAHYLGDGSGMLREGRHRSGKLELVDDVLASAFEAGEKVLLFTQFTSFGHLLVPYWEEMFSAPIPFLHGGVSKPDRDQMVARFQETRDEPGAMLLSLRAGGTGLTLTAANHVVHLDRWWNPAVENQATDRAFRIGQRKDVQVRKLVSAGTIEERIDQVLTDKSELADLAVGSGEGWISRLGDADLAQLFSLDRDQVSEGAGELAVVEDPSPGPLDGKEGA